MELQEVLEQYPDLPVALDQAIRIFDAVYEGLSWYVDHIVEPDRNRWEVYASVGLMDINLDWGC